MFRYSPVYLAIAICQKMTLTLRLLLSFFALHICSCNFIHLHPDRACSDDGTTSQEVTITDSEGSTPSQDCLSIDEALSIVESDDTLTLSPGSYTLHNFSTDVLRDTSNITIIGDVTYPEGVIINCSEGIGLFFFNVSNLTITGITLEHCGLKGGEKINEIMNITKETINILYTPLPDFSTAVYLAHCPDLVLSDVIIRSNRGFGLVGLNLIGNVTFNRVHVFDNFPSQCVLDLKRHSEIGGSGGGMLIIYHDFIAEPNQRQRQRRRSPTYFPAHDTTFHFNENIISNNYVCRLNLFHVLHDKLSRSIKNPLPLNLSMIGAGGITVSLAQFSFRVNVFFKSCLFHNNSGTYNGAAMHISQFEITNNSHVYIENTTFSDNGQELIRQYGDRGIGPGGALLILYYAPNPMSEYNVYVAARLLAQQPSSVTISNSTFTRNVARSGGAVCVISFGPEISLIQDSLTFYNTEFTSNKADFGGGIYLSELSYSAFETGLRVHFENIVVVNNLKRDTSAGNSLQAESGIIEVSFLNISLTGNNYIAYNMDTALSLSGAIATISGSNIFEYNIGSTGGAIDLSSESYLILADKSNISFLSNTALIAGGAIHVNFDFTRVNSYDCFVFFVDLDFFCDLFQRCDYRKVRITFTNNTAPLGSVIYGSTFTNCPWAGGSFESSGFAHDGYYILTKFEPVLTIRPRLLDNPGSINTLAYSIVPEQKGKALEFIVMPGEEFKTAIGAFDQLNQPVPLTIFSQLIQMEGQYLKEARASIGATDRYLINSATKYTTVPIRVFGSENSTYNLSITSNEAQVEFIIKVHLKNCVLGFVYNYAAQSCECEISLLMEKVACQNDGSVTFPSGLWIGFIEGKGFAQRKCISSYCEVNTTQLFLDDPDKQCRNNRSGILCGQCKEGYSRVIGSSVCKMCTNYFLVLIIVFALMGILLVVAISLLNISITDGYVNGIIFYCNILCLYFDLSLPITPSLSRVTRITVSWINLNFGIESCFYDGMTDIQLTALNLIFPLYLGAILPVITIISKYIQSERFAKLLCKINITHVFATLLLLTYTSIIRTSLDIISYTDINLSDGKIRRWRIDPNHDYFNGLHIFLFFVAIFFTLVLCPFPFFLLFPRISLRLPYVKRMKPLIDAFIAPLAQGRLFWVGFRILARNFFFYLTLLDDRPRNITLCVFIILITIFEACIKPFKTRTRNVIDILIMVNLTLLSLLVISTDDTIDSDSTPIFIAHVLVILFACVALSIFIYYLISAIPFTENIKQNLVGYLEEKYSIMSKYVSGENEKNKKDYSKSVASQKSMKTLTRIRDDVTHTSLEYPPPPESERDFNTTSFIRYRESLFEASVCANSETETI